MQFRNALLPEYDIEMHYTRRHLERVPENRFAWKPHEKSMALGHLAGFLAVCPTWAIDVLEKDSFDVAPATPSGRMPKLETVGALLERFDSSVTAGRAAIVRAEDGAMSQPWSLLAGGKVLFSQPRWLVLRLFFMNHLVHHRAQLGVYLRMNDVPVPAVYNDSADEPGGVFRDPISQHR